MSNILQSYESIQCLSCLLLSSFSKESAKIRRIFHTAKNIPPCPGKGVILQRLWDSCCKDETILIHNVRSVGRGAGSAGSGGAGVADDAVPAAGVVAVLPLVAKATAVAATVVVGKIHPQLPPPRRHDGHTEGRCRGHHDSHGAALHFRVHPCGLRGPHHRAHSRRRGGADGDIPCSKCQKRRIIFKSPLPYPTSKQCLPN